MFVTADVSKVERSSDSKAPHPWNMPSMWVTAEVLRLETSTKASDEQPWNISDISVAPVVSKCERSTEVRLEQPANSRSHEFVERVPFISTVLTCELYGYEVHGAAPWPNSPVVPSMGATTSSPVAPSTSHQHVPHCWAPGGMG